MKVQGKLKKKKKIKWSHTIQQNCQYWTTLAHAQPIKGQSRRSSTWLWEYRYHDCKIVASTKTNISRKKWFGGIWQTYLAKTHNQHAHWHAQVQHTYKQTNTHRERERERERENKCPLTQRKWAAKKKSDATHSTPLVYFVTNSVTVTRSSDEIHKKSDNSYRSRQNEQVNKIIAWLAVSCSVVHKCTSWKQESRA